MPVSVNAAPARTAGEAASARHADTARSPATSTGRERTVTRSAADGADGHQPVGRDATRTPPRHLLEHGQRLLRALAQSKILGTRQRQRPLLGAEGGIGQ